MGAIDKQMTGFGMSMKEAWKKIQEDDAYELGHDYYNGGANNCDLEKDVTSAYNAAKNKNKFVEDLLENTNKGNAYGICIKPPKKNTNKVRSVVKNHPQKGTRVWETVYIVSVGLTVPEEVGIYSSQTKAIAEARKYTEKHQRNTWVRIEKQLKKGVKEVAEISYKKASGEAPGEYLFLMVAPY